MERGGRARFIRCWGAREPGKSLVTRSQNQAQEHQSDFAGEGRPNSKPAPDVTGGHWLAWGPAQRGSRTGVDPAGASVRQFDLAGRRVIQRRRYGRVLAS